MMRISRKYPDSGVSEVVGEMLMIGLAILLIGVFSSVLGNFLPAAHDPSVTIKMTNDTQGNITLWHKGGDWVKTEDITVIISNDLTAPEKYTNATFHLSPVKGVFDLSSSITVIRNGKPFAGDETVSLVTPRAVIFTGRVYS